jgi:hypothetical protein
MRTEIRETGGKLEVVCAGPYTQSDLLLVIEAVSEARTRHPGIRKCIMDGLQAEFRLGGIDEFFVGEYAAKRLAGMRISLVAAPKQITKFLENAAYNRGLKFLVTHSRDEAEKWLDT